MAYSEWQAKLKPSRYILWYFIVLHGVVALSACLLIPTLFGKIMVVLLVMMSFTWAYHRWMRATSSRHVSVIKRLPSGQWQINYGDGRQQIKLNLTGSIVTPFGLVLYGQVAKRRRTTIWVLPDQLTAEQYHWLSLYCLDERLYLQ